MRPPRVLVVAYYFPPVGGGGVQRTLLAVRALAASGFQPLVITVDDAAWAHDESRLAEVPKAARVIRLPNPDWGRVAARRPGPARTGGTGPGRLRRWLVPDLHVGWSALAAPVAAAFAVSGSVDLVYATAPPYSALAAGFAARAAGVPWIADFRDGWTCCPTRADLGPVRTGIERRLEDAVLGRADRVLFASRAVRERCTSRFADLHARSETLLTGFDPRLSDVGRDVSPPRDRLEIIHAGALFSPDRRANLERFLQALRRWSRRTPAVLEQVRVRFLGSEPALAGLLAEAGLGSWVEASPALPRMELARCLRRSHVALALAPDGPRGGEPIPGKLFDAAAAERPVLALSADGPLPQLIRELGLGAAVAPDDARSLDALLDAALERVRVGESALPLRPDGCRSLRSDHFARRVVELCHELVGPRGMPCPSPSVS